MKDLFLGWILKPNTEVSLLEGLMGSVECLLLFFIIIPAIIVFIEAIKNKISKIKKTEGK